MKRFVVSRGEGGIYVIKKVGFYYNGSFIYLEI